MEHTDSPAQPPVVEQEDSLAEVSDDFLLDMSPGSITPTLPTAAAGGGGGISFGNSPVPHHQHHHGSYPTSEAGESTGHYSHVTAVTLIRNEEIENFLAEENRLYENQLMPRRMAQAREAVADTETTQRVLLSSEENLGRRTLRKAHRRKRDEIAAREAEEKKKTKGVCATTTTTVEDGEGTSTVAMPAAQRCDAGASPVAVSPTATVAAVAPVVVAADATTPLSPPKKNKNNSFSAQQTEEPPQYGAAATRSSSNTSATASGAAAAHRGRPHPVEEERGNDPLLSPHPPVGITARSLPSYTVDVNHQPVPVGGVSASSANHGGLCHASEQDLRHAKSYFWPLVVAPPISCDALDEDEFYFPFRDTRFYCYSLAGELSALRAITIEDAEQLEAAEGALHASGEEHTYYNVYNDRYDIHNGGEGSSNISSLIATPTFGLERRQHRHRYQVPQMQRVWVTTVLRQQLFLTMSGLLLASLLVGSSVFGSLIDLFAASSQEAFYLSRNRFGRSAVMSAVEVLAAGATIFFALLLGRAVLFTSHGPRALLVSGTLLAIAGAYGLGVVGRKGNLYPVLVAKASSGLGEGLALTGLLVMTWAEVGVTAGTAVLLHVALLCMLLLNTALFTVLPIALDRWLTEQDAMTIVFYLTAASLPFAVGLLMLQPADMIRRASAAHRSALSWRAIRGAVRDINLRFVLRTLCGATLAAVLVLLAIEALPLLSFTPSASAPVSAGKVSSSSSPAAPSELLPPDARSMAAWVFGSALLLFPFCLIPFSAAWAGRIAPCFVVTALLALCWSLYTALWADAHAVPTWLLAVTGFSFAFVASSILRSVANAGATLPIATSSSSSNNNNFRTTTIPNSDEAAAAAHYLNGSVDRRTRATAPPSCGSSSVVFGTESTQLLQTAAAPSALNSNTNNNNRWMRERSVFQRRGGPAAVVALSMVMSFIVTVVVSTALASAAALLSDLDESPRKVGMVSTQVSADSRWAMLSVVTGLCILAAFFGALDVGCVMYTNVRRRRNNQRNL